MLAPEFSLKSSLFYLLFTKPITQRELKFHFNSHSLLKNIKFTNVQYIITANFQEDETDILRFSQQFRNGIVKLYK